jgi:glycosyltransferase involved in cell wall biosynthesis
MSNKTLNKNILVSVIVPTRNSSRYLKKCLSSIKNQSYKNIEIIVVDNNSTDNTKKIAVKYTYWIYNHGPERTAQINFGVKKASGKYIYYTGGDLVLERKLVEEAIKKCEIDKYDAIYLGVHTKIKNPNIWQKVRALERTCYYKQPGMSAARFLKRKVFLKLHGLDEKIAGISDDLEFQQRLDIHGYKTAFIDAKENNLGEYNSIKIIIQRSLYYGWFIKKYMDKHPQKARIQYKLVRNEFIINRKKLLKNKIIFLFFVFYKLTQYLFGSIGMMLSIITKNNKRIEKILYNINYS